MARVSPYESMLELNRTVAPPVISQRLAWTTETPQLRIVGHLAGERNTFLKNILPTAWTCLEFQVASELAS